MAQQQINIICPAHAGTAGKINHWFAVCSVPAYKLIDRKVEMSRPRITPIFWNLHPITIHLPLPRLDCTSKLAARWLKILGKSGGRTNQKSKPNHQEKQKISHTGHRCPFPRQYCRNLRSYPEKANLRGRRVHIPANAFRS